MHNKKPEMVKNPIYRFDDFDNGEVLHQKKKNHLPAMGWNSWNAFGSGNTEMLTKAMADKIVELELDKLGYEYIVLDDGCYKPERVDGKLSNEEVKFPSGFKALADYIHSKGLKFGMYNDIGTNLCAGAYVGTCGFEDVDAKTYLDWDVDFLKVDNCYYLWDNATFSNPENARYVFAPNIKEIHIENSDKSFAECYKASQFSLTGERAKLINDYITGIGTFDGTGPQRTPVGDQSSEARINIKVPTEGKYTVRLVYASGEEEGVGMWLQLAVGEGNDCEFYYDGMLAKTGGTKMFSSSEAIEVTLKEGDNLLRIMNHRRQENTLGSYGTLVGELSKQAPDKDIILSICEWGKTQPQNWGYKVGDSWRILNDITFRVGADGDPGYGAWTSDYTTSVAVQYSKAVIMDEFAGLNKGWNDPDMLMIGMNGLTDTMNKSHMTMWCMLNSPLMLGLDLRRVTKGDTLWNIISNKDIIELNQDALGIQAKRIYCSILKDGSLSPDKAYITDTAGRVDILVKPLSDGSVAISFINLDENEENHGTFEVTADEIIKCIGHKMVDAKAFKDAKTYEVKDLWSKDTYKTTEKKFTVTNLKACDNITIKVTPL